MSDVLYRGVRSLARFWIWFFFKRVDVQHRGRVPAEGPVLLCANHPNNLIDSLLLGSVLDRKVHYLATAALFRNPVLARFLRACGVIPIYRRQDDPDKMDRNADVFAACHHAFDEHRLVAMYPEGTTHAESRVQRIKTGAARIALGYEAQHGGRLRVIPVGLSFEARKSFNGRVLVAFGPEIPISPYVPLYREDPVKAVETLTAAIQWAMEAQVVHVDRIDAVELVRAVEEVYRSELVRELHEERGLSKKQIDLFRLSRTIIDAVNHFKARDPARVERLGRELRAYRALLAAYHVRDEAVQARLEPRPVRTRLVHSWQALAGFPFFAYGALVNALPYFIPRWLAHRMAQKETDYATVRLLASIVALPLSWGLETWGVWRFFGGEAAIAFAVSLPLSGLLAYRYLRGAGRLQRAIHLSVLALTQRQAARRLIAERQAIVAELDRAKSDYLAATRGSSF